MNLKVEINKKELDTANVIVRYKVLVTNTGKIVGNVTVAEAIPQGFYVENKNIGIWTISENRLQTTVENLAPGESKEIDIILTWKQGEENLGTIENVLQLMKVSNPAGFEEDDMLDNEDTMLFMISIATGGENIASYVGMSIILIGIIAVIVNKKKLKIDIIRSKHLKSKTKKIKTRTMNITAKNQEHKISKKQKNKGKHFK